MPMVTEIADAVVGVDTHRDTHDLALVAPTGAVTATLHISNSDAGFS